MMGTLSLENFRSSLELGQDFKFQMDVEVENLSIDFGSSLPANSDFTLIENSMSFAMPLAMPTPFNFTIEESVNSIEFGPTVSSTTLSTTFSNQFAESSMEITSTQVDMNSPGEFTPGLPLADSRIVANTVTTNTLTMQLDSPFAPQFESTSTATELSIDNGKGPIASWSEQEQTVSLGGEGWQWTSENRVFESNMGGVQTQSIVGTTEIEMGNDWMSSVQTQSVSLDFQTSNAPVSQRFETQSETLDVSMGPVQLRIEASQTNSLTTMAQPTVFGQTIDFEQHATNWSMTLV